MYERVMETKEYILNQVTYRPKIGVILGSGLGDLVDLVENKQTIKYEEIPHFPQSTVEGHAISIWYH
jgi:purine-nucleoside phosphorylase